MLKNKPKKSKPNKFVFILYSVMLSACASTPVAINYKDGVDADEATSLMYSKFQDGTFEQRFSTPVDIGAYWKVQLYYKLPHYNAKGGTYKVEKTYGMITQMK